jgi:flagellin-like hook-associated protein FlgL
MSISGIGGNTSTQIQSLLDMRRQLDDLQRQLSTGQKSDSYAGYGLDRGLSIALRGQVATLQSYQQTTTTVGTRLSIAQNVLQQIDGSVHKVKNLTANTTFTFDQTGQTNDQQTAFGQLDQIVGSLNAQVGDQYLFSGKSPDLEPVESSDHILNGYGGRAGLKQIIAERKLADLGTSGLGRVTLSPVVTSPATLVGAGAAILPDAPAAVAGGQDIVGGGFTSAGGTLDINGTTVTINPGDNAAAILGDINAAGVVALTGVTASLDGGNHLVLTSANADAAVTIGAGSTLLGALGFGATTTNPTNLLTQGASPGVVTAGQTLTVTIGANAPLTIKFGPNDAAIPPEVSTLAELNAQVATLVGHGASAASVNPANGNITITAAAIGDAINIGGTANPATFGLGATTALTSNTVALSEDAAGHPFGFKLAAFNSTLTGTTVTSGGPPAKYTTNFTSNPNPGDAVTFTFTLPDNSTDTITLTATNSATPGANEFQIGATAAATAANFKTALTSAVGKLADISLTAASAVAASNDFFNIDASNPPRRVSGPPFDTATALVAGTSSNTVSWYRGEAGATPARGTAMARVDSSITVSYGMRANEQAVRSAVSNVAVFAAMTFSANDPNASARYEKLTQRIGANLAGPPGTQTVTDIESEIANAQTTMKAATDRNQQTQSALSGMLDTIAGVPTEQVGAEILALQTRLQASLQTTALLSKLSLTNYL